MGSLRALMYAGMILLFIIGWVMQRRNQNRPKHQNTRPPDVVLESPKDITNALYHTHWGIRLAAIEKLQVNNDPKTLKLLLRMLKDEDNDVREAAANALIPYGDQAIVGLASILSTSTLEAREVAIKTLRGIGTPATIPVLVKALQEDASGWIRVPAAESLGVLGGDEACNALISALDDPHPDVQLAVQKALQQIGTSTALNALKVNTFERNVQRNYLENRYKFKDDLIYLDDD